MSSLIFILDEKFLEDLLEITGKITEITKDISSSNYRIEYSIE